MEQQGIYAPSGSIIHVIPCLVRVPFWKEQGNIALWLMQLKIVAFHKLDLGLAFF